MISVRVGCCFCSWVAAALRDHGGRGRAARVDLPRAGRGRAGRGRAARVDRPRAARAVPTVAVAVLPEAMLAVVQARASFDAAERGSFMLVGWAAVLVTLPLF